MTDTINVLRTLRLPAKRVTDRFGAKRDWAKAGEADPDTGRVGWYPGCGYRPLHYGVDYGYDDHPEIKAPGAGMICYDASKQMMTFVPTYNGDPVHDAALYFRHVMGGKGFDDGYWRHVPNGSIFAVKDTEHTKYPHLHLEMAVTVQVYTDLVTRCLIATRNVVPVSELIAKGNRRGMTARRVADAVNDQMETDGIMMVETLAIFRKNFSVYKRNDFGYLGRDSVVVLDPMAVMKG